jgi:hypothetical protein
MNRFSTSTLIDSNWFGLPGETVMVIVSFVIIWLAIGVLAAKLGKDE